MTNNVNMPAMPVFDSSGCPSLYGDDGVEAKGLTKREMMAMHIMQGMISCENFNPPREEAAQLAVGMTDALLAELERIK